MANSNTYYQFTFADIDKYLQKNMSATERYQLEKAALADPFLADAIEGFETANANIAAKHLLSISQKITPPISVEEKEYTLADIEKYLQGKMLPAEMHAIEKAALKDPFLADAIEGFEDADFEKTKEHLLNSSENITNPPIKKQENTYNFSDIEQYLAGNLSSQENHEIEKDALKESLLGDAIEGYEQTDLNKAKEILTTIETTILGEKKETTKVVAMNNSSNKKQWLQLAASLILMIGIGSTIWVMNKKDDNGVVAYLKPATITQDKSASPSTRVETKEEAKSKTVVASNDHTSNDHTSNPIEKSIAPVQKPAEAAALNDNSILDDKLNKQVESNSIVKSEALTTTKENVSAAIAKKEASVEVKDNDGRKDSFNDANSLLKTKKSIVQASPQTINQGYFNNTNQLKGRVVNSQGEGIPYATLNLNSDNKRFKTILSDANGNFKLNVNDSLINANIEVIGYDKRSVNLNAFTNNNIVLEKRNNTLSEEIITTNLSSKKRETKATLGTPVGGLQSFEEYVRSKKEALKRDTIDGEEYVEGLVELEFDVDKLGKPYNISVTNANTVDATLSNKAIKIVKEGPAWIADKKKKKAKVEIKL